MTTEDIFHFLQDKKELIGPNDIPSKEISGISDDSRKIQKNFAFIAIKGLTVDGNNYISQAIKNGAILIVSDKDQEYPEKNIVYIKVKNARRALSFLASYWYGTPSKKLKIIGVTGTKGKTTTVHIIYHIMKSLGYKVGMVSTIGSEIGNSNISIGLHVTSPDVISLNKMLFEMVKTGCKYAVLEVSSHGIDQGRIDGIDFEVGVLTNIAFEHLDYHKTMEEYRRVKMSFVNSAKYKVIAPKKTDLKILPGYFNNLNIETAIAAVSCIGISKNDALKTLESFKLPEGRLERIENDRGINIYIDFAHTPDSLRAALKHLRMGTKGRLISVFGSAGERDRIKRPIMGGISAKMADISVITSEDPRSENVNHIIDSICDGALKSKAKEFTIQNYKYALRNNNILKSMFIKIPDRKKAIEFAITKIAQKGDTVAFFGKGHEKSMNLDGIHETSWSEKEIVRKYLE